MIPVDAIYIWMGKKKFQEKKKNNKPSLSGVTGALSRGKFF